MKKVFSHTIALTVLTTMAIQAHAEVVIPEPQEPLTLEQQVQQNTTNIQTNTDDIITNVYLNHENSVRIDQNTADIADLSNRLDNTTPNTPPTPDYSGFSMPFAAAGQPRNVVLLRRQNDDLTYNYSLRVRYENSDGETILINGEERTYNYLAVYGSILTDENSQPYSDFTRSVHGMNNTNYEEYDQRATSYDSYDLTPFPSYAPSENFHIYSGEGAIRNVVKRKTIYDDSDDGVKKTTQIESRTYTLQNSYETNGLTFNLPTRIEYRSSGTSRIRVQGIGTVEVVSNSSNSDSFKVVYYNVNGQTGGSLSGTPFEPGSAIYNLFF